ncbi:LysR family transcriptional regulator [Burkholderia plantarii]|uniref:LysR family transcriptional regulator n=1 Tax=Burkholderia plantarii TaxID=41899 RepID=UPI0018DE02E9|nr:LysR family transcriptional regulator [Burkholderia plantarii]MBI0331086.1 LysR family transcriptional regulator [Burkholderia plantarii]
MRVDQLAAMRLYVRIVETGSFGKAARALGMSASNATERIARLEAALGVRLLARTTRALAPTEAGARYFEVCRRVIDELDEVEASLSGSRDALAGRVRVDANVSIARAILVPRLPPWFEQYPGIRLELRMSDQRGDFVRDGIDFAIRIGGLEDQDLVHRPLGRPRRVTVASPDYLARTGRPATPDDLARHRLIDFLLPRPGESLEWEFDADGQPAEHALPSVAGVADADARLQLAVAGAGIVQSLDFIAAPELRAGRLERLLTRWETPAPEIAILYPRDRHMPARTLATMDAFAAWIRTALEESER